MPYLGGNEASRKFTEAFKKVGARMWNRDEAHPLKPKDEVEITKNMQSLGVKVFAKLDRPLTVLDSYPDVTNQQRASLDREVNRILRTYQKKLDEIMNSFK